MSAKPMLLIVILGDLEIGNHLRYKELHDLEKKLPASVELFIWKVSMKVSIYDLYLVIFTYNCHLMSYVRCFKMRFKYLVVGYTIKQKSSLF